jgi:hypothetical protein
MMQQQSEAARKAVRRTRRRPAFRPDLSTTCFLVVTTGLLFLALQELRQSARFADLFVVAERIEHSGEVGSTTLARTAADAESAAAEGYCRSDIVLAGTTVMLRRLDATDQVADYEAWLQALRSAQAYVEHALSCLPADSNLWLRLAVLRAVGAEDPKSTARLMSESVKLAPADQMTMLARLGFWNRFSARTLEEARPAVESDVGLLFSLGEPGKIVAALPKISGPLLPFVKEAAAALPPERRLLFAQAGLNLDRLP